MSPFWGQSQTRQKRAAMVADEGQKISKGNVLNPPKNNNNFSPNICPK
jgi:hypothetical protein